MTINVCASFLCLCPLLCLFVCVMHTLLLELSACIHSVVLFVRALYHHEHYNSIKVNLFTVILADRNFLACSYTYLTPHTHPHTHPSHTPHTPHTTLHTPSHTPLTHPPYTQDLSFSLSVSIVAVCVVIMLIVGIVLLHRAKKGHFCCLKPVSCHFSIRRMHADLLP